MVKNVIGGREADSYDSPSTVTAQQGAYVPALDGMRAVAITGVFALHLDRAHVPGGAFGVDVFFVLSAYLITGNLLREHSERGKVKFSAFYWRRAFRLMPALITWVALFAIPTAFAIHQGRKVLWSAAGSLFYVNDFLQAWTHLVANPFDQTWSLAVEEQFYLVWPALLVVVVLRYSRRARQWSFIGLVIFALLLSVVTSNYFLPTGHLIALALGCWAANQSRDGYPRWAIGASRHPLLPFVGLLVFLVVALHRFNGAEGHIAAVLVDLTATFMIVCIAVHGRSWFVLVLGSVIPRWIGARSYGIYLYGLTLMALIPAITHLRLTEAAPLDVVATYVVAWASYRYVESPVRRGGREWLGSRAPRTTFVPPTPLIV